MIEFAFSCLYLFTTVSFFLRFAFWDALFVFSSYNLHTPIQLSGGVGNLFLFLTNMVDDMG